MWREGALPGSTPDEAFFVRCDRTTMTQDDLDTGRLAAAEMAIECVFERAGVIRCESIDQRQAFCPFDIGRADVRLERQLSRGACVAVQITYIALRWSVWGSRNSGGSGPVRAAR